MVGMEFQGKFMWVVRV